MAKLRRQFEQSATSLLKPLSSADAAASAGYNGGVNREER
ncbi:hypothetical protein TC41_3112 [Alicyclobacillus acidocaldarius subsp. acidocaldarius Tc-4-1]|uniref:Uncharacterized protein n=1 Tax=Alicyclobacillus acidocaldarius (strain Tc-4-1) TaxID=1048834 RepID=F8ICZ1_ALIAT|nr:hypothetical protein TC41_3112 [Alicyclobacillus acidocaldarius subsp. acidocaldarius Tc-4-1]